MTDPERKTKSAGLIVKNLQAEYKSKSQVTRIFTDINFDVEEGSILAIFGPNGCGKSTLLRVIGGLKNASNGVIENSGEPLDRNTLSLIPQDFRASFFNWCSLKTNIALTQHEPFKNLSEYSDQAEKLKSEFGIDLDLSLRPHECSGGMLQQAALLRAFISSPKVLLADEPFSALDVNVSGKIRKRFVEKVRKEGTIVIAVMHSIEEIIEIADNVLAIPNMPYSSSVNKEYSQIHVLANRNPNKNKEYEENNFVSIAKNIISLES